MGSIIILFIVLFIVGIILAFGLLIVLTPAGLWAERKYKKDAYRLLDKARPSSKDIQRNIKGLSPFQDAEARELVKRLFDKRERIRIIRKKTRGFTP